MNNSTQCPIDVAITGAKASEVAGLRTGLFVIDTARTISNVVVVGAPKAASSLVVGTKSAITGFLDGVKYAIALRRSK